MSSSSLAVGWGSVGVIVATGLAESGCSPLLEVGVVLTFPASAPVCLCKPCLLTHLTLHKGRRQSHPRVLYEPPRGKGALAIRMSSSSSGKGEWERCAQGGEKMEGEELFW